MAKRRRTYGEIMRQPSWGGAAGLVAALLYDSISGVRRLLRRRTRERQEQARAAKHAWRAERKRRQREARLKEH